MGLDVYAKVVVGLPGNKVFKKTTKTKKVKKFNEDNGSPYEKSVPYDVVTLFGVEIDDATICGPEIEGFDGKVDGKEVEMEFHCYNSDGYEDYDSGLFGFTVASMGGRCNGDDSIEITDEQIQKYRTAFKKVTGFDGEVHLTMHYSY